MMMKHQVATLVACLLLATVFRPLVVEAQQFCSNSITATTPASDFTIPGDGTVTHIKTGLMWQQCSEGQTYANCAGSASTFTWQQALQRAAAVNDGTTGERGSYTDWRLPNKNELESIVEERCARPAINATVFPNTEFLEGESAFWSSSPFADDPLYAWGVNFSYCTVGTAGKTKSLGVRLVRGGQLFDLLAKLYLPLVVRSGVAGQNISPNLHLAGEGESSPQSPLPSSGGQVGRSGFITITTDANGNYRFADPPAGTYTFTPAQTGQTFTPASRNVTLPLEAASQNFTRTFEYNPE